MLPQLGQDAPLPPFQLLLQHRQLLSDLLVPLFEQDEQEVAVGLARLLKPCVDLLLGIPAQLEQPLNERRTTERALSSSRPSDSPN